MDTSLHPFMRGLMYRANAVSGNSELTHDSSVLHLALALRHQLHGYEQVVKDRMCQLGSCQSQQGHPCHSPHLQPAAQCKADGLASHGNMSSQRVWRVTLIARAGMHMHMQLRMRALSAEESKRMIPRVQRNGHISAPFQSRHGRRRGHARGGRGPGGPHYPTRRRCSPTTPPGFAKKPSPETWAPPWGILHMYT